MLTGNAIILIIDSPQGRSQLKKDLSTLGFVYTIEASTTNEATARLEESSGAGTPVTLVLCDWETTKVEGEKSLQKFRTSPLLMTVPIVMMMADCDLTQALVSSSSNINGYLVKPYTVETLKKGLAAAWTNQKA